VTKTSEFVQPLQAAIFVLDNPQQLLDVGRIIEIPKLGGLHHHREKRVAA
jgi:hypothetical protein